MCEIACNFHHKGTIDFEYSNIRIYFDKDLCRLEARFCQHCEDPVCMTVCDNDAIAKDESSGLVTIDPIRCIGCQSCIYACPLGTIYLDKKSKVSIKCDGCGMDPNCVKYCSPGALGINE